MSKLISNNQIIQRNKNELNAAETLRINLSITQNMIQGSADLLQQSRRRKQLEKSETPVVLSADVTPSPAPPLPTVGDATKQNTDICIKINGESLDFKNETAEQILSDLEAKFDPKGLWTTSEKDTLLNEIKGSLDKLSPPPKAAETPVAAPAKSGTMATVG